MSTTTTTAIERLAQARADAEAQQRHVAEIAAALETLHPGPDPYYEVRAIKVQPARGRPFAASGYFRDHAKAAAAIVAFDAKWRPPGMYVTINRPIDQLYGRSPDAIKEYAETSTADAHIGRRRLLLIDCDPDRPAGTMASDAQREAARTLAADAEAWLTGHGWPQPLIADSGSGYHLFYKIDLENDAESLATINAILKATADAVCDKFVGGPDRPTAGIDLTVGNAARIVRVPGTMNRKGLLPDLWRRGELFKPPDDWQVVPRELLAKVAALATASDRPKAAVNGHAAAGNGHAAATGYTSKLLVEKWLADRGYACTTKDSTGGWTIYKLDRCPFMESHGQAGEVSVMQGPKGQLAAECKHNSCAGQKWPQFKAAIGPPEPHHFDPPLENYKASKEPEQEQPKVEIAFINSAELDHGEFKQNYLIADAITEKQGGIISAGYKLLKTSIAVDAGVSVASGTSFLGHFGVPEARRVAIFSAESGLSALQETARRVCAARGLSLRDLGDNLLWSTARVALTGQAAVDALGDAITARDVKLAVIDPAYLFFPLGNTSANLYAVGEVLAPISDLIESTGCTVLLVNHNTKHRGPDIGQFAPPELSEISGSGWAEWARFWILLGRRREWDCETGQHWLWLQTGGSAGHAGLVAVDVTEGKLSDPGGRRWEVSVSAAGDARAEARQQAERRKAADREKREADYERRIHDAIKLCPDGETQSQLCRLAGINSTHFLPAIRSLMQGGKVKQVIIKKNNKQEKAYVSTVQ